MVRHTTSVTERRVFDRLLAWLLGGLAVTVVVGTLTRRSPTTERDPAEVSSSPAQRPPLPSAPELIRAMRTRFRRNNTVTVAAALSYYAMLSLFPAAIAAVSIYGIVADPVDVERQADRLAEVLPEEAAELVGRELESIVASGSTGLGIVTITGILVALWSASAGVKGLVTAVNMSYGEPETRPILALRGLAFAVTLGLVAFVVATVALVTFLPGLLRGAGLGTGWERGVSILRWPAIFSCVVLGLGLLYKLAPNRPTRGVPLFTYGSVVAALMWLVATVGFSVYANNLGSFNQTYGALGSVIVLMLWFFISGLVVLLGAELNDELDERGIRQG